MTSSPRCDCHRADFKVSRSFGKTPHANEILMFGIDVGKLHIQEHQDLQRANSTNEAEPEAEVDDSRLCMRLRECHGPGLCIFSLAAEFWLLRFSRSAPAVQGRIWATGREGIEKGSVIKQIWRQWTQTAVAGMHTDTLFTHWYTVFMSSWVTMSTNLMHGTFNLDICFLTMVSKAMSGVNRPLLQVDTKTQCWWLMYY